MKMSTMKCIIQFVFYFYVISWSDISPESYRKLQEAAEEYLNIAVLSVKQDTVITGDYGEGYISVEVNALVTKVIRTKNNVKNGDIILIKYNSTITSGIIDEVTGLMWFLEGPAPVPILTENKEYPAFLNIADDQNYYKPAAGGESFSQLIVEITNPIKIKHKKLSKNNNSIYNIRGQRIKSDCIYLHNLRYSPAQGIYISDNYKIIHYK